MVGEIDVNVCLIQINASKFAEFDISDRRIRSIRVWVIESGLYMFIPQIYAHSGLTRYKLYSTDTRLYRDLDGPRGTDFQHVMWAHSGQGLVRQTSASLYPLGVFGWIVLW